MPNTNRISFRFRGKTARSARGSTLLDSLLPFGLPTLQRSIRYHRPRAPFCGIGYCTQCLVRVNGVPDIRACRYLLREGDQVETENAWPGPRYDLLGLLDVIFWKGIDTLHGFRRPRFASPLYQRVVRSLAGYGSLPRPSRPEPPSPGETHTVDCLVIGAGPAGRRASERLAESRLSVGLADRDPIIDPPAGVRSFPGAGVFFLPPPRDGRFLAFARDRDGRSVTIVAPRVLLAPGAYDSGLWFWGNDRPGVLTADGALRFLRTAERASFRKAVIFGGGPRAAELIDRCGTQVEAVVAPGPVAGEVARRAADLSIALYPRTLVIGGSGRARIRRLLLAPRGGGSAFRLSADALVLAHRRYPNSQLFFQAGAAMAWRSAGAAYYPVLEQPFATSVTGLFAAGEAAGYTDGAAAEASGIGTAEAILGHEIPASQLPPRVAEEAPHEMESYYRELLQHPATGRGKAIACSCEDVLLDEVRDAGRRGYTGIEVVKRYTGLGTGLCQGRYCLPEALLVLSILEGRNPSDVGYITQRPPVEPISLSTLSSLQLPDLVPSGRIS